MENTNIPQPLNTQPVNTPPASGTDNGKTIAILSYITLIGWIIALVMHGNNKTSLGAYHLRQGLGIMILGIAITIIRIPLIFIPFLGWILGLGLSLGLLAFWIMGLISAVNEEEKPLPLVGSLFQNWFANFGK